MASDSALREKLKALKGVTPASTLVASVPSVADQVQRARSQRHREAPDPARHAALLDAQVLAPGVLFREEELPFDYRHGEIALRDVLGVDLGAMAESIDATPNELVFLDTETTGLAGGTGTLPFLVGTAQCTPRGIYVRQYLLTGFGGEQAMLEHISAALPGKMTLVTFNGKTFDIPLLSTRLRLLRLPDVFQNQPHIDLVHATRRAYGSTWDDCRLVTAESRLLGFSRQDDISGAEVPQVWFDFVRFDHTKKLRAVMQHNFWDVLTMVALLPRLVAASSTPATMGADVLRVARYTRRRGGEAAAREQLQQGREKLTAQGELELARLLRRQGEHAAAAQIWHSGAERGCLEAMEFWAKYLEHVQKDYDAALRWTQRLLDAQPHHAGHASRLNRLKRRMDATS